MIKDNEKIIEKIISSIKIPIDGDTDLLLRDCLLEMAEYKDRQYNDMFLVLKDTIKMVDTKDEIIGKLNNYIINCYKNETKNQN